MITVTPISILVKISFFAIGFMFFGLSPISAKYPHYRLLLSPSIWLFWRIPTHAEWAITRLQAEATRQLTYLHDVPAQQLIGVKGQDDRQNSIRIGRYHCTSEKRHGNLCVSTDQVSFENHLTANERWSLKYEDLKGIEKVNGNNVITSGDGLLFTMMNGTAYAVSGLKLRDVVFSQIIGYSNVQWQRMN
jgi:hypothetical protein